MEAARVAVETKYLAGHPALFPARLRRWEEARYEMDHTIAMQARLGELDGWLPAPEPDTPVQVEAQVAQLIDDFVESARVHALEKLDEGGRAFAIATRWLRPKLERQIERHDDGIVQDCGPRHSVPVADVLSAELRARDGKAQTFGLQPRAGLDGVRDETSEC